MEAWEVLEKEITQELELIKKSFSANRSLCIIEIVRCLDNLFYLVSYGKSSIKDSLSDVWEHQTNGFFELMNLFIRSTDIDSIVPLSPTTPGLINWTNFALTKAGSIGFAKKLLFQNRSGLVEFKSKDNVIFFSLVHEISGLEYWDKQDAKWIQKYDGNERKHSYKIDLISRHISKVVRKQNIHFIKYGSTPVLDKFFKEQGIRYSEKLFGIREFPPYAKFNGVMFEDYVKVIQTLIGWTLKHNACCDRLVNLENGRINTWNIRALPVELFALITDLSDFTGVKRSSVLKIVSSITLDSSNIHLHNSPGNAPAPLIKISNSQVIRSTSGIMSNPFQFLIRELRERFKRDYDIAIQYRERVFRNLLFENFTEPTYYKYPDSIELTLNGRKITDIDALIYDADTNTLGLFQLKWMDLFGDSMKERRNKQENFNNRATEWIKKIDEWLKLNSSIELLKKFKNLAVLAAPKVYLFVIGKHYSNFSGVEKDKRATWSNFYQIRRLRLQLPTSFISLVDFKQALEIDSQRPVPIYPETEVKVGNLVIKYVPEGSSIVI